MKPNGSLTLALAATLLSSGVIKPTDAHLYGGHGGGGGGGLGLLAPRGRYQYSRSTPHRDAFDLMSDILSVPVYMNSLMRQHHYNHHHHHRRIASDVNRALEQHGDGLIEWSDNDSPRYAVTENPETETVELSLELPGVVASDLSVSLEDDKVVRIAGRRKHIVSGRLYETEFDQSFRLTDDLDPSNLQVTLSSGILRIQAKKKVKAVRQIPIVTSEDEVQKVALEPSSAGPPDSDGHEADTNTHGSADEQLTESDITIKDE